MTEAEALALLREAVLFEKDDAYTDGETLADNGGGHSEADKIILSFLKANFPELGAFYERVNKHSWFE